MRLGTTSGFTKVQFGVNRMKKILSFAVMTMLVLLAACGGGSGNGNAGGGSEDGGDIGNGDTSGETFKIGVIPAQTVDKMETAMGELEKILDKQLESDVSIKVYPGYSGVVEAMNYGHIDMGYFGPLTYVEVHEQSGAKAILTQLIDGEPYYHSYMITHVDQPWESLDDMLKNVGKVSFAFGDPESTSGMLIPSLELKDRGVFTSLNEHKFESVRNTGSHNATALAVVNKQVDAGAIDSAIYNQLVDAGKIDENKVKVIWESDQIFQYPWAVSKDTSQETVKKLQEAFLNIDNPEILNVFGASGFTKASNEDYEFVRQAAIKDGRIEK